MLLDIWWAQVVLRISDFCQELREDLESFLSQGMILDLDVLKQGSPTFLVPGTSFGEDYFPMDRWEKGWFQDDLSALYLLYTLFLLLLHQLHLRSWGTRSRRLGMPALESLSQFSRSVMSDSLRPHGLQHARPPCPSPTPGAYPNSCASSQWCHPTISSSVSCSKVVVFKVQLQIQWSRRSHSASEPSPALWLRQQRKRPTSI